MIKTALRHYIVDYAIKSLYDDVIKNFSKLPCITYYTVNESHIGIKYTSAHTSYGIFHLNGQFLPYNEDPDDYKDDIVLDIMIISHDDAIPHTSEYERHEYGDDMNSSYFILLTVGYRQSDWAWRLAIPFDSNSIVYL